MSLGGGDFALVTRHIRKLRGGSQPILALASDGLLYVVKFTNNLQGTNVTFNESVGTELYRACNLPVPPWKKLLVTDSFLDKNPDCWMETPDGRIRPDSGMCFGSRFLGQNEMRLLEILPSASFKRVRNHADFWLAWMLDICAEHADSRQAIFAEDSSGWLDTFFIDHGHLFGGPDGTQATHSKVSTYLDPRIYQDLPFTYLFELLVAFKSLDVDKLWKSIIALPDDWKSISGVRNVGRCLDRVSRPFYLHRVLCTIIEDHAKRKISDCRAVMESVLCARVQNAATEQGPGRI